MKDQIPNLAHALINRPDSQLVIVGETVSHWAKAHPSQEATIDNWLANVAGYDSKECKPRKATLDAFNTHLQLLATRAPDRAAEDSNINKAKAPRELGIFGRFNALANALPSVDSRPAAGAPTSTSFR